MHKSFLLTLLFPLQILPGMAQSAIRMVVGTYTDGTSRGIYSFVFDQVKGIAHALDTLDISNPSFLTISQNGSRIYAVSENSDSTAAVNAIRFDSRSGKMQLINSQSTKGADPCYVSTNGRILLTANYSGGSLSIFPLAKDGSVLPMSQQIKGMTASSDMPQQSTAHIHCAQFSPSGQEVLATDFSANRLIRMTLHQGTALSSPTTAALMPKNSGCRHFVWSNDNKYCYVISELSGAVTVLRNTPGLMPVVQQI
ncbi:MAG: lactonase family protein, partial [Prevotella sp.]